MYYKENTLRHALNKTRFSIKTTKEVKALIELVALRKGVYASDLIHTYFEQLALASLDDISDTKINELFKEAANV